MQSCLAHSTGRASSRASQASVSVQKAHSGRSGWEKALKNSAQPPAIPSSTKPRSSPELRRSRKRNTLPPAARQYRASSQLVMRGSRSRKARSRS